MKKKGIKQLEIFDNYFVDITGQVWRQKFNKKNYPYLVSAVEQISSGFRQVIMYKNINGISCTKGSYVHHLVAKYFLPNPENKKYIEFLDGNKLNCHVKNLKWIDKKGRKDPANINSKVILSLEAIKMAYAKYQTGHTLQQIADEYNVSVTIIWRIVNRKGKYYSTIKY